MKGAMSSATARLSEAINAILFPNVIYGVNSGGDPKEIPRLTYEELKQFHQNYYHPSRCLFFFYGNMPLEQTFRFYCRTYAFEYSKRRSLPSNSTTAAFQKTCLSGTFLSYARR